MSANNNTISPPLLHALRVLRQFFAENAHSFPATQITLDTEIQELGLAIDPNTNDIAVDNDTLGYEHTGVDDNHLLNALNHYSQHLREMHSLQANKGIAKKRSLEQQREVFIKQLHQVTGKTAVRPICSDAMHAHAYRCIVGERQRMNILAVAPMLLNTGTDRNNNNDDNSGVNERTYYYANSCADKTVHVYSFQFSPNPTESKEMATNRVEHDHSEPLASLTVAAPVLTMATPHPAANSTAANGLIACGLMNGSVCLLRYSHEERSLSLVSKWADPSETKYILNCKFSPDNRYLLTGAYSGRVRVFSVEGDELKLHREVSYARTVEAIDWLDENEFYCVQHEDHLLRVVDNTAVDANNFAVETTFNMNELQDSHVSFTVLALAVSPCKNLVALATDKNRVIVYGVKSSVQVKNFYSVTIDSYSSPKLIWSANSRYLYVNSERAIHCLDLIAGQSNNSQQTQLSGHTDKIKSMAWNAEAQAIISGGFDKSIRIWAHI